MFVNKNLFDDAGADPESEPLPPNKIDKTSAIVDNRKTKMKDFIAEQQL